MIAELIANLFLVLCVSTYCDDPPSGAGEEFSQQLIAWFEHGAPPRLEDMTVYATWYNPERCMDGEGCQQGSGDGLFASMAPVSPEWHMNMVACDSAMFGEILSINIGDEWANVYCGDSFGYHPNGDPVLTTFYDHDLDTWFTRIDFYWSESLTGGPPEWGIIYLNGLRRIGQSPHTPQQMMELGKIP